MRLDSSVLCAVICSDSAWQAVLACGFQKCCGDGCGAIVVADFSKHDLARISIYAGMNDHVPSYQLMVTVDVPETVDPRYAIDSAKNGHSFKGVGWEW